MKIMARRVAIGITAALLLSACGGGDTSETSVFRIRPGDCFNDPAADRELEQVDVVPCDEPHDNEVFATLEHPPTPDDIYLGRDAIVGYAEQACPEPFNAYVGVAYQRSRFSLFPIVPSEATWAEGDRQIICALYDHQAGKLTGSMRGSGV